MAMTEASPEEVFWLFVARLSGIESCVSSQDSLQNPSLAPTDIERASRFLGAIELHPHQVEGARLLGAILERHGGALLADDVGLGKTYTALAVARDAESILVVAPAALRQMWLTACARCGVRADVTSYERLSAGRGTLEPRWSLVILDEAHHARTPATRRHRALCTITRGARVLLLSATPIHNRRRDLSALVSLFLGSGADAVTLDDAALSALVVRRRVHDVARPYPMLSRLVRHEVAPATGVLPMLAALPPPLPPSDGGVAQALVVLQLTRAWCSSDAALLAAIRRRLTTAASLEQALECGRLPSRRDLATWTASEDGSVQLTLAELVAAPARSRDVEQALSVLREHAGALRALRAIVRGPEARDHDRFATLTRAVRARRERQAVIFTHSTATAEAAFTVLRNVERAALLTGHGARLVSGAVSRHEVLSAFAPDDERDAAVSRRRRDEACRIDVLIATDVVSEGVNLQRAATVIHLDLPWTMARLEQRVGRLRRLGSPHTEVDMHLIAPPVGAGELDATIMHLTRKAQLASGTMGTSSILGDTGAWLHMVAPANDGAPALARHSTIAALKRLLAHATNTANTANTANARTRSSDESKHVPHSAPPLVARWSILSEGEARAFALVSLLGEAHILLADSHGVTLDPGRVLVALESAAHCLERAPPCSSCKAAAHRDGSASGDGVSCDAARVPRRPSTRPRSTTPLPQAASYEALESAIAAWCRARAAESELALPAARASGSHRRLLRAVSAVASHAPRPRRAQIARCAADGRRLILSHQGAGAEQLLDRLAASAPLASAGTAAGEHWLEDLVRTLRATHGAAPRSGVTLEAVLTCLPAPCASGCYASWHDAPHAGPPIS